MKKISVIMPVYNVEAYICKSLESVVHQTYPNLEIICVNDGSTDRSGEICDEYARRDSRVKVVHQANRGCSSAINAGLDIMTGDYVGFVDPDDWVELHFFEEMVKLLEDHDVDFVCSGRFIATDKQSSRVDNKADFVPGIIKRQEIMRYTFMRDSYRAFGAYYWNKLFRVNLFNPTNGIEKIRFWEEVSGGDVLMFIDYVMKANTAYYFDTPYYHYYQREGSLDHAKDLSSRSDILKVYTRIIEKLENSVIELDLIQWVKRFYVYHASLLAELAMELQEQDKLRQMQNEMNRYLAVYMDTNREFPDRLERINRLLTAHI
ncbi:glycosyltransferase family 2 protein [Cohnella soli]|uniref:Glycosyltransferase family 2 protein n=1 Tax=Cohnella soli TaxID=425005 RepID=A0ABW0HRT3_9BACL